MPHLLRILQSVPTNPPAADNTWIIPLLLLLLVLGLVYVLK